MQHPLRRFKAELFKALSHPGRIKMLEALRAGEKTVGELQALLDDEPGSASQHLALLRARDIVVGRKEGNNIFYSVRDPLLFRILDAAREIFSNQLVDSQEMLSYVREEEEAVGAGRSSGAEGT
jgi:ArsR family transcriptional regulator